MYGEDALRSPLKPGITPVIFITFLRPNPTLLSRYAHHASTLTCCPVSLPGVVFPGRLISDSAPKPVPGTYSDSAPTRLTSRAREYGHHQLCSWRPRSITTSTMGVCSMSNNVTASFPAAFKGKLRPYSCGQDAFIMCLSAQSASAGAGQRCEGK